MDINFIPPPPPLEHQVLYETHQPAAILETRQHVTVHQVHSPEFSISHPFVSWTPAYPLIQYTPVVQQYSALVPSAHMTSMGDIAMHNFAPKSHAHDHVHTHRRVAYIVTYSTTRVASGDPLAIALYKQAILASGLQPVITFDVGHFPPPPADLCARFTGVSSPIQEVIRQFASGMRDL